MYYQTKPHDPAFPGEVRNGLTVREHFAALALQGLLAGARVPVGIEQAAQDAVVLADALIAALNRR